MKNRELNQLNIEKLQDRRQLEEEKQQFAESIRRNGPTHLAHNALIKKKPSKFKVLGGKIKAIIDKILQVI